MKISKYSISIFLVLLVCLASFPGLVEAEDFLSFDDLYGEDVDPPVRANDPFEPVNRFTFGFNDLVFSYVLRPVSKTYTAITPDIIERGASNFFDNLNYPVRLAGNLLQGRLKGAWVETGRFAVNTVVGVAGVMTPADHLESFRPIPPEDVGQAFGTWGIGAGPYLVLPFFGPSNLRDLGGMIGDRAVHPLKEPFSLIDDWDWEWRLGLTLTDVIVSTPDILERYEQLRGSSIDPYSAVKNGYTQFRQAAIEQ